MLDVSLNVTLDVLSVKDVLSHDRMQNVPCIHTWIKASYVVGDNVPTHALRTHNLCVFKAK